ncbi:MAG TPA: PBP1A family penicillin-binding protein [Woeseiaceae bacterium]|nr:PBP1A family penicillin-binding protein [Woeseiaceae bacterium]
MRTLVVTAGLAALVIIGGVAGVIGAYYFVAPGLPAAQTIRDIPLQIPLRIYSRDGHLIEEIGQRRRILVRYDDVPPHVVAAFIAAEDQRFFVHPGIDYRGILRALSQLLVTGEVASGGSTLTQQLARSYFLSLEQTAERKFKEASLAVRIEQEFTKEQIMELFLNKMFFGQRAYGVAAAAQVYFNKPLASINIAEAATLAGVLPAPSRYNPVRSPTDARRRRGYVLGRMLDLGFISRQEYDAAMALPVESHLYGAAVELNAPYVAEMVRREMLSRYGEETYTAGFQVVTSLDSRLQKSANYALRNGLLEFTRRRGYRGPITTIELPPELPGLAIAEWPAETLEVLDQYAPGGLSLALVTRVNDNNSADIVFRDGTAATLPWRGMSWAKPFIDRETTGPAPQTAADVLAAGDVIYVMPTSAGFWALAQVPEGQAAIVSLDPDDGAITSLTGGFDFATSKFNRATQSARQPGSSFKPFIYSAALEQGNTPATVVLDAPVVINSSELEAVWRPINYSGRFYGPTRMREALVRSMNLVSVRLLLFETGIGNAVRHIAKFGFNDAALPRNGSLALGGGAASPLDMAQGYAIIANGGFAIKPYVIDAIYGADGSMLYRADPAVVCEPCLAEPADDYVPDPAEEMTLEEMMDIAPFQRPDASTAPELFADVNAAPAAVSIQNAYLIQDMMRDVIRRGTGRRALVLGRKDLSGKTGTSNDRRDAWFGGFNRDLAAIVWVGYDNDLPLGPGEEGSRTALPVWIEFMREALRGVPEHQMPMPPGIVSVLIDKETGCPARAGQRNVTFEMFRQDHVPECETVEELPDIFNDTTGIGDGDGDGRGEESGETEEPLF